MTEIIPGRKHASEKIGENRFNKVIRTSCLRQEATAWKFPSQSDDTKNTERNENWAIQQLSGRSTISAMLLTLCIFALYMMSCVVESCSQVEIVSRSGWGARASLENDTMQMPVSHIFIHHTVSGQCLDFASCAKIVRGIQNYHMDDRSWDDIGYNFLVGGDGRAYEGRGWSRVGAHTYGFNRVSIAFALLGDFSTQTPSDLMLQATKSLIGCALQKGYVSEDFQVHGHRDGGCTECPGAALYGIIKSWTRFVAGPVPGTLCWNEQ